jgi:pimeloyl-ACP methyl ester carboxylesterase
VVNWNPKPLDPGMITLRRRGAGEPVMLLHCLGQSWRLRDSRNPLTNRNELIACSFSGQHDSPPAARWVYETIKGRRMPEIPPAGHASVRERPEFVVPQLHAFLD